MLAGGADIDPATYGAEPTRDTQSTRPERDRFELALARAALERDLPLLGDLPRDGAAERRAAAARSTSTCPTPDDATCTRPGSFGDHDVRLEPGSLAARAAGAERLVGPLAPPPGGRPSSATASSRPAGPSRRRRGRGDRAARAGARPRRPLAPRGGRDERGDRARWSRRRGGGGGVSARDRGHRAGDRAGDGGGPAGRRRGGRRGGRARRRRRSRPGARSRPATARRCCARSPTRSRSELEDLATLEARNAGKPIGDARGEIGMVVETFRYYAGAPERLLGQDDPGRRRRRHDLPRAARRRRA